MLKLVNFFSIISIWIFISFSINAQSANLNILESYPLFSLWAQRNYSYQCDEIDLQKKMSQEIPKILFLGLQAIKDVNSELLSAKMKANGKNGILFTCIDDDKIDGLGALFEPTPFYLTRHSLKFSWTGEMIILPKTAIRNLSLMESDLNQKSLERRTDKYSWLMSASKDTGLEYQYAVLHEYLHFLKFDNFSTNLHNELGTQNSQLRFDDDLVYACADLSFPSWTLKDGKTLIKTKVVVKFDIENACVMCALARDNGRDGTLVDDKRMLEVFRNCQSYKDLKRQL